MIEKLRKIWNFFGTWTGSIILVLVFIMFFAQAFVIPSGSMRNTLLEGDFLFGKKYVYGIPVPHIPWIEKPILPDFRGDGHLTRGDDPKRGDIVIFRFPLNHKQHFVKRLFAVGGDEVIYTPSALYLRPHEGDEFIDTNFNKSDIVVLLGKKFVKEPLKFKGIHYENGQEFRLSITASFNDQFAMSRIFVSELPALGDNFNDFNAFYKMVEKGKFFMIGDNRDNSNDSRFWGSVDYSLIVGQPWFVYFSLDENRQIRWDRVGRFVDTLQNESRFIKGEENAN